jgi:septum formation protein
MSVFTFCQTKVPPPRMYRHPGTPLIYNPCSMLILASSSARRADLLRNAGIEFTIHPSHVPEFPAQGEIPLDYVRRLAREKAQAIAPHHPGSLILGADTTVIVDQHMLEKPADEADTDRMLRLLSGRAHQVTTGVCLISPGGEPDVRSETTQVTFAPLTDDEIRFYISTGEPVDRAGAYAIQGYASRWVTAISGCYFNVVGLPIPLVYRMLTEHRAI